MRQITRISRLPLLLDLSFCRLSDPWRLPLSNEDVVRQQRKSQSKLTYPKPTETYVDGSTLDEGRMEGIVRFEERSNQSQCIQSSRSSSTALCPTATNHPPSIFLPIRVCQRRTPCWYTAKRRVTSQRTQAQREPRAVREEAPPLPHPPSFPQGDLKGGWLHHVATTAVDRPTIFLQGHCLIKAWSPS